MSTGAVLGAVLVGAFLGVVVHLVWPTTGAAGGAAAPAAQVAGVRASRSVEPGDEHRRVLGAEVLRVEASGCGERRQATATVVQGVDGGLILTNAHVVRGSGTVILVDAAGVERTAVVLGAVVGRDAAVLRLDTGFDTGFDSGSDTGSHTERGAIAVGGRALPGDAVVIAGYPAGRAELGAGTVVSVEARTGYGATTEVLVIDAPLEGGSSGGAVLDEAGRVVGIVAARDPRTGAAVAYPIDAVVGGTLGPVPSC